MRVYVLSRSSDKCACLRKRFTAEKDVEVVCGEFSSFMRSRSVECIVSPANSFGRMEGGYDLAIAEWFGDQLQRRVQRYILEHFYGEQPVGTSFIIDAGRDGQKLIHTPTMRTPQRIPEPSVVYQCMRATLMCAFDNRIQSIVIPVFGGGTGGVPIEVSSEMMWRGYRQITGFLGEARRAGSQK